MNEPVYTIAQIEERISRSRPMVGGDASANLLWKGYLMAVFENFTSLFESAGHMAELEEGLGPEGHKEVIEMLGGPITDEEWEEMRLDDEEYARTGVSTAPQLTFEEDLAHRIQVHLGMHNSSRTVICLWKGFLAAVLEWKLIDREAFERLRSALPPGGEDKIMPVIFYLE